MRLEMYFCIPVFCHYFSCSEQLKILNIEIPTRKNFEHTKYPREMYFDPQSTYEKICLTYKIPTWKIFLHTKYSRVENWIHKMPTKKNWIHEKRTRKTFGATKYARSHDSTMVLDPRDPRCKAGHEI